MTSRITRSRASDPASGAPCRHRHADGRRGTRGRSPHRRGDRGPVRRRGPGRASAPPARGVCSPPTAGRSRLAGATSVTADGSRGPIRLMASRGSRRRPGCCPGNPSGLRPARVADERDTPDLAAREGRYPGRRLPVQPIGRGPGGRPTRCRHPRASPRRRGRARRAATACMREGPDLLSKAAWSASGVQLSPSLDVHTRARSSCSAWPTATKPSGVAVTARMRPPASATEARRQAPPTSTHAAAGPYDGSPSGADRDHDAFAARDAQDPSAGERVGGIVAAPGKPVRRSARLQRMPSRARGRRESPRPRTRRATPRPRSSPLRRPVHQGRRSSRRSTTRRREATRPRRPDRSRRRPSATRWRPRRWQSSALLGPTRSPDPSGDRRPTSQDRDGGRLLDADGEQSVRRRSETKQLARRGWMAGRALIAGLEGRRLGHDVRLSDVRERPCIGSSVACCRRTRGRRCGRRGLLHDGRRAARAKQDDEDEEAGERGSNRQRPGAGWVEVMTVHDKRTLAVFSEPVRTGRPRATVVAPAYRSRRAP